MRVAGGGDPRKGAGQTGCKQPQAGGPAWQQADADRQAGQAAWQDTGKTCMLEGVSRFNAPKPSSTAVSRVHFHLQPSALACRGTPASAPTCAAASWSPQGHCPAGLLPAPPLHTTGGGGATDRDSQVAAAGAHDQNTLPLIHGRDVKCPGQLPQKHSQQHSQQHSQSA